MCLNVVADPVRSEVQGDGRRRYWGEVALQGQQARRILRVVTLEDGVTIHNAFLDRGYREDQE
jgi:hypothetical protein